MREAEQNNGAARTSCWRVALFLVLLLGACAAPVQKPPPPDVDPVVEAVIAGGDGRSAATAYRVPGMLWEYRVLERLGLRFLRQRAAEDGPAPLDIITVRNPRDATTRKVWFRVVPGMSLPGGAPPAARSYNAQIDRIARAVFTSGDGRSPETAFVVGGYIQAEYQVMRSLRLGARQPRQALHRVRGCDFDMLDGQDPDTGEPLTVWFKLGRTTLEPPGPCVLTPTAEEAPR